MSYKILENYISESKNIEKKFIAKFLLEFCQLSENKYQYEEMLNFMLGNGTVEDLLDMYKLVINDEAELVELYYIDDNKDEILMSKFTLAEYKKVTKELMENTEE